MVIPEVSDSHSGKFRTPVPVFVGHLFRPCSGRASLRQGVRETYPVFELSH